MIQNVCFISFTNSPLLNNVTAATRAKMGRDSNANTKRPAKTKPIASINIFLSVVFVFFLEGSATDALDSTKKYFFIAHTKKRE